MFHYVGNFKHWTAETKNGTFRSPCREMAHLVGTEIFDKKLKKFLIGFRVSTLMKESRLKQESLNWSVIYMI